MTTPEERLEKAARELQRWNLNRGWFNPRFVTNGVSDHAEEPYAALVRKVASLLGVETRPYGFVQDDLPPGVVLVATRLWEAIAPQFDPNEVWTEDEWCPLLRTFTQVLIDNLDTLRGSVAATLQDSDEHVIELREDGWTIMHPLSCRPNLFDCPVNRAAEQQLTEPPAELGRFRCALAGHGEFVIGRPPDAAAEQVLALLERGSFELTDWQRQLIRRWYADRPLPRGDAR